MKNIKRYRKISQILFFILTIIVFEGSIKFEPLYEFYGSFHIFPLMSRLLEQVITDFMFVGIIIVILSFIFGRLYCSWLCPMGFIQDLAFLISKKLKIKRRSLKNNGIVRYFILFLSLTFLFLKIPLYGWFDYYSNLGMIMKQIIMPTINFILKPLGYIFSNYKFLQLNEFYFELNGLFFYSIIFLTSLFFISLIYPRWFCNLICPTGALYSLFSRNSIMNFVPTGSCRNCHICNYNCPVEAIDDGIVNKENCIACFECVEICPPKAFGVRFYSPFGVKEDNKEGNKERRDFLKIGVSSVCGVGIALSLPKFVKESSNVGKNKVLPPGAMSAEHYFSKCTGCNLCTSVCPNGVLEPISLQEGISLFGKPVMNYNKSFCSYDCNECSMVCPTGALGFLELEKKRVTRVGMVSLNKSLCVAHSEGKDCGACAEQCPTGAVFMKDDGNGLTPHLMFPYCIGCGACENICPVTPKAIVVRPMTKQTMALKPKKNNNFKKEENGFPF